MEVLVLEDDYLLASSLAEDLNHLGAAVLGPFASVEEAVEQADGASAAIVDVRIGDETSFALADCLLARHVPFVFYTGARCAIAPRHKGVPCFDKPASAREMLNALVRENVRRRATEPDPDVADLIPDLRALARQMVGEAAAADRLVELALLAAIEAAPHRSWQGDKWTWLVGLLRREHERHGRNLFN